MGSHGRAPPGGGSGVDWTAGGGVVDERFDFAAYVARRKAGGRPRGPAPYAYEADRRLLAALGTLVPVRMAVEAYLRTFKDLVRAELLGGAVRVSSKQFPLLFEVVSRCSADLGIAIPEVFVKQDPIINAFTYGTNDDSFIVVHSATVDHMDEAELRFIMGHECGHVQNEHVTYVSLARDLERIGQALVGWILYPARLAVDAWMRRAEITCDRAGLICCRDPEAARRALVKLALGSKKLYEGVDVDEFLAQAGALRKTLGRWAELAQSHPYLPKRVAALDLFRTSVLYPDHPVGEDEPLGAAELDERVSAIVSVS